MPLVNVKLIEGVFDAEQKERTVAAPDARSPTWSCSGEDGSVAIATKGVKP